MLNDAKVIGITAKWLRLIKMPLRDSRTIVLTTDGVSDEIETIEESDKDSVIGHSFPFGIRRVVRACDVRGAIAYKSVQLVAYADDIVIVARDMRSLEGLWNRLRTEAHRRVLEINQSKTKYMNVNRSERIEERIEIEISKLKFKEWKVLNIFVP